MMKLFLAALFFLFVFSAGCRKDTPCTEGEGDVAVETRNTGAFRFVDSRGNYNVSIRQDTVFSVQLEAQENILKGTRVFVDGNQLVIETDRCYTSTERMNVYITAPVLDEIALSGSGTIQCNDLFTANQLSLRLSGSGSFVFPKLNVLQLSCLLNGQGNYYLGGFAIDNSITVNGSGFMEAYLLETQHTVINVPGSANLQVTANSTLSAMISGSADVFYRGNVAIPSVSITGSGQVTRQ